MYQDKKNLDTSDDKEKIARIKFIIIMIILFFFIFLSLFIYDISFETYSDEIKILDKQYFGTASLLLFMPYLLFTSTVLVLIRILILSMQTNKKIFSNTLQELRKPTQKKIKRRIFLFWIFIILSFLSILISQLFLYLGITLLI